MSAVFLCHGIGEGRPQKSKVRRKEIMRHFLYDFRNLNAELTLHRVCLTMTHTLAWVIPEFRT